MGSREAPTSSNARGGETPPAAGGNTRGREARVSSRDAPMSGNARAPKCQRGATEEAKEHPRVAAQRAQKRPRAAMQEAEKRP